eukprot:TRINITY_DN2870_c0_g1_i2.p2 TRINITY_DN2870_c0_g1~~TRINITY_DN2870_c0_g1_i2.p2  ORF type:complete len:102 (-),score=18.69 TRINITY_DN2870_c0_g1_i2:106-411(-)
MFRKLADNEKALAREIDKSGGVKNCWNFQWLQEKVQINWKEDGKERNVEVQLGDTIAKIDKVGKALCSLCDDLLSYASNGKKALKNHIATEKHVRLEKLRN